MSRILCIWELGEDLGHIEKYSVLANELIKSGHELIIAAKDLSRVHTFFWNENIKFVQSPIFLPNLNKPLNSICYAEILLNRGYHSPTTLGYLIKAWVDLFSFVNADIFIFDHSPTALLAARQFSTPKIIISNSFVSLPPGSLPLSYYPLDESNTQRFENNNQHVLHTINKVFDDLGLPVLENISDIFSADLTIFPSYKDLDFYNNLRSDALFLGPMIVENNLYRPEWNPHSSPKILAYLKHGRMHVAELLDKLLAIGANVICYYADSTPEDYSQYVSTNMHISNQPVNVPALMKEADIVISHAGMGMVSASLFHGKAMILLPTQIEQLLTAMAVAKTGAGICIKKQDSKELAEQKLNDFFKNPIYSVNARKFSETSKQNLTAAPLETIVEKINTFLN